MKPILIIWILLISLVIYFIPFLINEVGLGCTLDDIHPNKISIEEIKYWVTTHNCNNKVIFVIPFYQSESLINHEKWCSDLIKLSEQYNFKIGLHGYKHKRFGKNCGEFILPSLDFFKAYKIYESAFKTKPEIWRSPCFNLNIIDYFLIKLKSIKNYGFVNSGETYHPNNLDVSWCKLNPSWKDFLNKKC